MDESWDLIESVSEGFPTFINSMKNNKAAYMSGLTAEHGKYGSDVLAECVLSVVNFIITSGQIPAVFKQGVITSVYKKQGNQ